MSTPERPGAANRTLVVWCPDWPLVAAGIAPTVPAAAFHANRVVACTAAARAEGVVRGLRRREAQGRCPELVVERHDPARDARAFESVVAAVAAFTPRVEVTRPGICAIATRGPSRYFGGDAALADVIRAAVDSVLAGLPAGGGAGPPHAGAAGGAGWGCRVGIADGPFAAVQAARRDLIVAPGTAADFLAPLTIGLLDEPELTDLLGRLGVRTLGAFAALPAADVVGRFGPVGAAAHRRARGIDDRSLDATEPRPDLTVEHGFESPADRVDAAAFAAKSLADGVCGSLADAGLVCRCVRIEAETEHGERMSRVWRHHRAFTPAAVAQRVRWQLEGWLAGQQRCGCAPELGCPGGDACPHPVGGTSGGLTLLRLVPEDVAPDEGRQVGFWGGTTEDDERAARGLARIQGLLGHEAVVTAVLGGGRGPADQVRLVPWGEPRHPARPGPPDATTGPSPAAAPAPAARRPRRPTRADVAQPGTRVRTSGRSPSPTERPVWPGRLPRPSPAAVPVHPRPAEVVDATGAPVRVTGRSDLSRPPARLSIDGGSWADIVAWAGPWTADERWWDPADRRRQARFQVVVDDGAAYLVTLERGRWRIEAVYD
jgi:protein ImuB